jgi:23S rRNA (adenine2503-C2)-methyltransferase
LQGRNAHVNVIPMNAVSTLELHGSSGPRTEAFVGGLSERGVNVTVRKRKGADIDAACGQLRLNAQSGPLDASGAEGRNADAARNERA